MSEKLIIFPYNGNALEAIDCVGEEYELIGFADDTPAKWGEAASGHPVWDRQSLSKYKEAKILAVPGGPKSFMQRAGVISGLQVPPERFARVIHPKTSISSLARIGRNVLIMSGVVLTSNCVIGDHVCILPNTVIHHDTRIGDYGLLGSGVVVAGTVILGQGCYIGSGSRIINNVTIGEHVLVGLGSTVIRDIGPGQVVAGNPARVLKKA